MNNKIDRLVLENVSFHYNGSQKYIVKDLSLDISSPSITSLLGLNGSGKTTLLMLLLGYYKPQKGAIYALGAQGKQSLESLNGLVGYLPQRENIPFDYSVAEFISMGLNTQMGIFTSPNRDDLQKIEASMQFLDICDLSERHLSSISGGELQRVRIARLLVQDPQIILLDEPSSHLDIKSKNQIIELIESFKRLGKMVIFSTHDPLDALNVSDLSVMMKKGKEIIKGKSADIVTRDSLSSYFDTHIEIDEINGQRVILVKNGTKTGTSA
jgi:ABC-type cobalamin/Fe3+-siderophores transport system ATPase subunit